MSIMKGTSLISIYSFFMKWREEIEAKTPFFAPKRPRKTNWKRCSAFFPPLLFLPTSIHFPEEK